MDSKGIDTIVCENHQNNGFLPTCACHPHTGNPDVGNPYVDNPDVEYPDTVFPDQGIPEQVGQQ